MITLRRDATEFAGKRLLLIGSSYSAEDITLQCLKYVLVCRSVWSHNLWRGNNLLHCTFYKNCCPLFKLSFEKVRSSTSNMHLENQTHGLQVAKQCEWSVSNDTWYCQMILDTVNSSTFLCNISLVSFELAHANHFFQWVMWRSDMGGEVQIRQFWRYAFDTS